MIENWIVAGAIVSALVYLALRGYARYKKETRKLEACQSCPMVRQLRESGSNHPRGRAAE